MSGFTGTIEVKGYNTAVVVENDDGVTLVQAVAKIGDKVYLTLEDAVADIALDGSDTTIEILCNIDLNNSLDLNYGTGKIIFTAEYPVVIKQAKNGLDFALTQAVATNLIIEKNVTFQISDNSAGMYLYYGPSLTVNGTVTGGANWGCLYLFNGDHIVGETGIISVGRTQIAFNTVTVNGKVQTNYLLVEGADFTADGAEVNAGVIHDSNNGGMRWGASDFVFKNGTQVTAGTIALAYAESTITIDLSSSIVADKITGAGKIIIDATGFNTDFVQLITADMSGFTGTIEVVGATAVVDTTTGVALVEAVATVNGVPYSSFDAAFAAATAGQTLTLLGDVTLSGKLTLDKAITIDGNGHKIIANHTAFILEVSADATVKNVTLDTNNKSKGVKIAGGNATFDNITIPNSNKSDAITIASGASLTVKTYINVSSSYTLVDARGGPINAEPGTVFDILKWSANASPAKCDLKGAVDANGNPYFAGYSSTAYFKDFNGLATTQSNVTLLRDLEFSSDFKVKGTLNLNGNDITFAEGKRLVADNTGLEIIGEGTISGEIYIAANKTLTAPAGMNVTTDDGYIVSYASGVYASLKVVARIGTVGYASLQAAIDAANDGDTVVLVDNIALTTTVYLPAGKSINLNGNGFALTPAAGFTTNDHHAVIVLANADRGYSANSNYTVENLKFEGFTGLSRVIRANFCNATIENCVFENNSVNGGVITSADAVLKVNGCTFSANTVSGDAGYGVIDLGSDVGAGTQFVADISNNSFVNNTVEYAVLFLFSSADVSGNYFSGNVHQGTNPNAAAILAGPYTGNLAYTINIVENVFDNAISGSGAALPAVYAEDWRSLGVTTEYDLSANYWKNGAPVYGVDYVSNLVEANIVMDSFYTNFTVESDGSITLSDEGIFVARIGGAYYTSLQAAVDAAQAYDEIVVLADITATVMPTADSTNNAANCFIRVDASKIITIDLNGKTISVIGDSAAKYDVLGIRNHGNLTIKDSVGNGKLTYFFDGTGEVGSSQIHSTILNFGTLVIDGGIIENTATTGYGRYTINNYSWGGNANLTVNGGVISNATTVAIYADGYSDSGVNSCNVTVTGGTVNGGIWYNGRTTTAEKNITISGGVINAGNNGALTIRNIPNSAVITGGTFNGYINISANGVLTGFAGLDVTTADGYVVSYADGKYTSFYPVAQIGETRYPSLEAAIAAANDGDVVVIIVDTLNFAENAASIVIDKAITVKGQGKNATTLNFNSATSAFVIASDNVTFCDMTITQGTKDNSFAISISKGAWNAPAIQYSDVTISDINFIGGDYGLCLIGENVVVSSCTFTSQDSHNIIVYSLKGDSKIIGNVFNASLGNNKSAVLFEGGADNATDLSGFIGGGTLTISGNEAYNKGVFFQFTNWGLVKNMSLIISENKIDGTTNKAIALYDMDGAIIPAGDEFASIVIYRNVFTNTKSGRPIIREYTGAFVVEASGNYFGSATPDLETLVVGAQVNVDEFYLDEALTLLGKYVAEVDGVKYTDIKLAFKAVTSGSTVKLLADVTVTDAWDCRYTGSKFTVPVTIDGDGHTIKFTNTVYDGGNYMSAFRFEADAIVKNLTMDLSEAKSGFATRIRAISAKGNLTVDNCTFIGNGAENNTRAIIFGEGAGANAANLVISITGSTFEGWKYGVSDNENAQDVKSVTVSGNSFTNANVNVSANTTVVFNNNVMTNSWVHILSYTADSSLAVEAKDNTLAANAVGDDTKTNYIDKAASVDAQSNILLPVATINGKSYFDLEVALRSAREGDTILLVAGTLELGSVDFPATLKNVTIKGADGKATVIKNSSFVSANGNSAVYEGITIDGIVFDNSRIAFTGCRNGEVVYKNWVINNCEFKNINGGLNSAVHFNLASDETFENLTFTNNVIDGVSGGNFSGLRVNYASGDLVITGNDIKNVAWNAIQIVNSNLTSLVIEDNKLASSADEGILNIYNVSAASVSVTGNRFYVNGTQPGVCNAGDIDVSANYWGGNAPVGVNFSSYYLDEALTQLFVPIVKIIDANGNVTYYDDMLEAIPYTTNCPRLEGVTIVLLKDVAAPGLRFMENDMVFDLNGFTYTIIAGTGSQGTNTSGFQIRPEVTTSVVFKNGTINVAAGAPVVWMFNSYATEFILENVTVDCANMDWSRGGSCLVMINRAEDTVKFIGTTEILNFNSSVAGFGYSVGGAMVVGENVVLGADVELGVGATLTAPVGIDVATKAGYMTVYNDGVYSVTKIIAMIGETCYPSIKTAVAALKDGDTLVIVAGEHAEGSIKLPASLTNVTIKGADGHATILKDMTITAADGGSVNYVGLTFEGIVFENSNLVLGGQRSGTVVYKDLTINNCIFRNLVRGQNLAALHMNLNRGRNEVLENFIFTNNVIDGVGDGSNSGININSLTGNVTITGNVINNVSFRPLLLQLHNSDGIVDELVITDNVFSGSAVGRLQIVGNNGTDAVNVVLTDNIFKDITDSHMFCIYNITADTLTATLSGNYYDINVIANPDKFYLNSAADDAAALHGLGIFPIYTDLNDDGTINTASAFTPVAAIGTTGYQTLAEAIAAASAGDTVVLLKNVELAEILTIDKAITLDGNGMTLTSSAGRAINVDVAGEVTIKDIVIVGVGNCQRGVNIIDKASTVNLENVTASGTDKFLYASYIAPSAGAATLNITDSHLTGWAAISIYGVGSVVNVEDSVLVGINTQAFVGTHNNQYSTIAIGRDVTGVTITVNGGSITAQSNDGCEYQFIIGHNEGCNGMDVTLNTEMILIGEYTKYLNVDLAEISLKVGADCVDGINAENYALVRVSGTDLYSVQIPVVKIGTTNYASLADAVAAANNGDKLVLLQNVTLASTLNISKSITIDGAGFGIAQIAGVATNNHAFIYVDGESNVAFENITFDGINGTVIRTVSANVVIDNCVFKNITHTGNQGIVRLNIGSAEIKNSKFLNNKGTMILSFNYDAYNANDTLVVDNCVFEGNTASEVAILYYVDGASCTITNTEFVDNTVVSGGNAATVYLGFTENNVITGNLFKNNSVTVSGTSARVAGAIFFGYAAEFTGNALINNTSRNDNVTLGQVVVSTYYDCEINLSGNYWGGNAPVANVDYTLVHADGAADLVVDSFNASYTLDDNGNVVLGDETAIYYAASIGKLGYFTVEEALAAAVDGDVIVVLGNLDLADTLTVGKNVILDLGDYTINVDVLLTVMNAKVLAGEGVTVYTDIADHKVVFADGEYKIVAKVYVAEADGVKYESVIEALMAVSDGGVLKLLANLELDASLVIDKAMTLDLNGKTLTAGYSTSAIVVDARGNLDLVDTASAGFVSSVTANGKLTLNAHVAVLTANTAVTLASLDLVDSIVTGDNNIVLLTRPADLSKLPAGYVLGESANGDVFVAVKFAAQFLGGSIKYANSVANIVNMRFGYDFAAGFDFANTEWGWYVTINGQQGIHTGMNYTSDNRANVYISNIDVSMFETQIYVRLFYVVTVDGVDFTVFEPTTNSRSVVDVATAIVLDSTEPQACRNYAMAVLDANNAYANKFAYIKKDDEESFKVA